jgi:hypothetical protein
MKKGDSSMWWIIIGAVLALVVMIVLMIMFTGKTSGVEQGLSECSSKGGECMLPSECKLKGGISSSTFTCSGEDVCCFTSIIRKDE